MKLSEIASLTGGTLTGEDVEIYGLSDLDSQRPGTIAYAESKKNLEVLAASAVSALIIGIGLECASKPVIKVEDPRAAFSGILTLFSPYKPYRRETYPSVYIEKSAVLGSNLTIMPFTSIMDNAVIGDNCVIYSNVTIGKNARIGKNCVIKSGARIDDETVIGDNCIIHHNAVIGGDGFGYVQKDGRNIKVPQVGRIIIGDDVEIGACATVDRAMIGETVIGNGVKIDNLVQVAHNVKLGDNCILVAQVGVAGSSTLGKNCIITGQAGVADHTHIGDNVVVMAQSGIESNKRIESDKILLGSPARDFMEQKRIYAAWARLPELLKRVNEIEKRLKNEKD